MCSVRSLGLRGYLAKLYTEGYLLKRCLPGLTHQAVLCPFPHLQAPLHALIISDSGIHLASKNAYCVFYQIIGSLKRHQGDMLAEVLLVPKSYPIA